MTLAPLISLILPAPLILPLILEFNGSQQFLMGDGKRSRILLAGTIMGGDEAQKKIALFHRIQAVVERALGRNHRHRSLMRHPDLIAEAGQDGIDAFEQFLDAVNGRGHHDDQFFLFCHLIHLSLNTIAAISASESRGRNVGHTIIALLANDLLE